MNQHPTARRACVGTSLEEEFYVFGGCSSGNADDTLDLNDLWKYNFDDKIWDCLYPASQSFDYSDTASYPGVRRFPSIDVFDGRLLIFGGCGQDGETYFMLNDLWFFDIEMRMWENESGFEEMYSFGCSKPPVRYTHVSGIYNGKFYVFSGWYRNRMNGERIWLNDLWCYDFTTCEWRQIHGRDPDAGYTSRSTIPGVRYGCKGVIHGEKLYIFGGHGNYSDHNDLWEFDLKEESWTCLQDDNFTSGSPLPRYGSMLETDGEYLYLFGGRSRTDYTDSFNDFWRYDLMKDKWSCIAEDVTKYGGPTYRGKFAHAITDKNLLIFGGEKDLDSRFPNIVPHSDELWSCNLTNKQWKLLTS